MNDLEFAIWSDRCGRLFNEAYHMAREFGLSTYDSTVIANAAVAERA